MYTHLYSPKEGCINCHVVTLNLYMIIYTEVLYLPGMNEAFYIVYNQYLAGTEYARPLAEYTLKP